MNEAIEQKLAITDPVLEQVSDMMDHGKLDEAVSVLNNHLAANPNSVDGLNLLRAIYWRKNEMPAYQEVTLKVCALYLKGNDVEPAWQSYEDFVKAGGEKLPVTLWLDLCRVLEAHENFQLAFDEYEKIMTAYPKERQSLMAQLVAARLCLKRLGRPQDALKLYEAAAASAIPHLDLEQNIALGVKESKQRLPRLRPRLSRVFP